MMVVHNNNKKFIFKYRWYRRGLRSLFVTFFMLSIALIVAHGQAEPITPPAIITSPGTYVLTGDVTGIYAGYGIKIEASDVVLDGQGFSLQGSNQQGIGILVNKYGTAISNVQIKNISLGDWDTAIRYNYVKGDEAKISSVSDTQISDSKVGVHVEYSDNIVLSDLSITDTDSGIVVNHESNNVTIDEATISKCGIGVILEYARGVTLSNSNVNTCEVYGIQTGNVDSLTISKTTVSDNKYAAITLANVNDFTLHSNVIARTQIGAALQLSSGIANGLIYDNLFQSKENIAKPSLATIVWYIEKQPGTNVMGGPYLGGNYWGSAEGQSGFSDSTPDSEGYGITDIPYEIDEYNIDKYPLHKTDKKSLSIETPQLYTPESSEYTNSSSDSALPLSITSMPFDDEEEIPDIGSVAVTNLFTSRPNQTQAPLSAEMRGLSSSALLSAEGMSFLVFVGAPDGATVWLIGDAGAEQAGVVSGGVLTVPVNPAGPFYNAYRITAPGYITFEERFRAYPSTSGMSVVLTVTMEPDHNESTSVEDSKEIVPILTLTSDINEDTLSESSLIPTPVNTPFVEPVLTYETTLTPLPTPVNTPFVEPVLTYEATLTPLPTPVNTPFVEPMVTYEPTLTPLPTAFETVVPDDITPIEEVVVTETLVPTGTGYLTFSANVDGATIVLIDADDKEHIVGTITQGSHIVPIEIGVDFYRAYRVEKDGYSTDSGYLYDYPDSDGENREVIAVLKEQFFNIIAAAGPNGQVTPPESAVKPGETLTIRISPDPGYKIEIVQVDGEVIENPGSEYTFTKIQSDHVLVASFN
jgi:nitrous oxidase accessory protein NosD